METVLRLCVEAAQVGGCNVCLFPPLFHRHIKMTAADLSPSCHFALMIPRPKVCVCAYAFHAFLDRNVPNAPHKFPDPWHFGRGGVGVGLRGMTYRGVGREYGRGRYIVNNGGEGGLHSINNRSIIIYNTTAVQDGGVEAGGGGSVRVAGKLVLDLLPELLGLLRRGCGAETVREGDQLCRRWCGMAE
jgi:hypothetical protein